MNYNTFCVFDFETGGRNPHTCEILQIGAIMVCERTLTRLSSFTSFVKPHNMDTVEDDALKVNGISREMLDGLSEAFYPEVIWAKFSAWVNKYNKSKGAPSPYNAPIQCGFNTINFDMTILRRYCKLYGPWDLKNEDQKLFNQVYKIDVMDLVWLWFEHSNAVENLRLTTIAKHLGVEERRLEKAHDALVDCEYCADIIIEYLRRSRLKLPSMNYMKDMLKPKSNEVVNE